MREKYLLCRPLGGLNDNLVQIEKCWRYAEKYGRKLLVDTTRSRGILLPFYKCFKILNNDYNIETNPTIDFIGGLECLSTFPSEVQGRLNSYSISYDRENNYVVDDKTGVRLSFDHLKDYCEDLLVHEQDGGGQLSLDCLKRLRLSDKVKTIVEQRLSLLPKDNYLALHIRHSDYQTDYMKFFQKIYWQTINKRLLVCSDNIEVIQIAKKYFRLSDVFSLHEIPYKKANAIHNYLDELTEEEKLSSFVNAISDIFALAFSYRLFIAEVCSYRASPHSPKLKMAIISGYSQLAVNLQKNRAIINQLMNAVYRKGSKEGKLWSISKRTSVYVYRKYPWQHTFKRIKILGTRTTPEFLRPLFKTLYRFIFS